MSINVLDNLIIFRQLIEDEVIQKYSLLYNGYQLKGSQEVKGEHIKLYYEICSMLINKNYDSINDYIVDKILTDENIFSISLKNIKLLGDLSDNIIPEKIKKAVFHDISVFKKIFEIPVNSIAANMPDVNKFLNYDQKDTVNIFKDKNSQEIYDYLSDEYSKEDGDI